MKEFPAMREPYDPKQVAYEELQVAKKMVVDAATDLVQSPRNDTLLDALKTAVLIFSLKKLEFEKAVLK